MKWLISFALTLSAVAAGIDGKWQAKFDTPVGEQHYTYDFKSDGGKLTGTAANDMGSTEIKEGVIEGDTISFVENLDFNGNAIHIQYKGTISGDEIKFVRKVGDFATEEFVAKRDK
jgi:hypothetical protein